MEPKFTTELFKLGETYLLAISGGGDSMALAHLAKRHQLKVAWAHFNHRWNPSEDAAAAFVANQAQHYGVPLHITHGHGKPASNAEAHARAAREAFFAELCRQHGYAGVVLAHTQTDVAETFLMRAGKGSGVRGLAAMQPLTQRHGLMLLRPLLQAGREELRAYLSHYQQSWQEDPENAQQANQRAKVRALLPALEAAGVPVHGLAAAARALARADAALQRSPESLPLQAQSGGTQAEVALTALLALPSEQALRQMETLLRAYHPNTLPPRTGKRLALLARLRAQPAGQATLGGLLWRWQNEVLRVWPEHPTH